MDRMIVPPPLEAGSTVAILSPAGSVNPDFIHGAAKAIMRAGWRPKILHHACGRQGTFSGTIDDRIMDIDRAWLDPDVHAILCGRGGYGMVQMLRCANFLPLHSRPKWVMGFSDISAWHALMVSNGVVSMHCPMCRHLSSCGDDDPVWMMMQQMLRGELPELCFAGHKMNVEGEATGKIVGGNMAVLSGLTGTPFDIYPHGTILFIEDIGEPIYKVNRMLWQLYYSGALERLSALIVGQFTLYEPDANYQDMYTMIEDFLTEIGGEISRLPRCYGAPIGHVKENYPILEGHPATLRITKEQVTLNYLDT